MILLKRVYDTSSKTDGYRVLVDRLWPRGLSKEKAQVDYWLKEIAPSHELRKWFHHDTTRWEEFKKRYREELKTKQDLLKEIHNYEKQHKVVTLLFGAKDTLHNEAILLKERLENN
jgi:uncharacterized protein YeaO (DUF488 family)